MTWIARAVAVLGVLLQACSGGAGGGGGGGGGIPAATDWAIGVFVAGATGLAHPSLALDPEGNPHVAYVIRGSASTDADDSFHYTYSDGTRTFGEVIASAYGGTTSGDWISLAVDSTGVPHVVFHVADVAYRYGIRTGLNAWAFSDVPHSEAAWAFLGHSSIALDPRNDTPHVTAWLSNAAPPADPFFVAHWTPGDAFTTEIDGVPIASDSTFDRMGLHNSIAVDAAGGLHVSYARWDGEPSSTSETSLGFAHFDGTTWALETLDDVLSTAAAGTGHDTAIAAGPNEEPHIVYRTGDGSSQYRYTFYDGNDWVVEPFDVVGSPGDSAQDIAVDADGVAHACLFQAGINLIYGTRAGGAWSLVEVDAGSAGVGAGCSIAVADDGTVHIVYIDPARGLKHAVHPAP